MIKMLSKLMKFAYSSVIKEVSKDSREVCIYLIYQFISELLKFNFIEEMHMFKFS